VDTRLAIIALLGLHLLVPRSFAGSHRGIQFIGFTNFQSFTTETNAGALTLSSPEIRPEVNWNELVPSWNYRGTNALTLEVKAVFPDRETKWYSFGDWSSNTNAFPRHSIKDQQDTNGTVLTDTLQMKQSGGTVRLRVNLHSATSAAGLKLLGLCFSESVQQGQTLSRFKNVWGKTLRVPERSQAVYPEGISSWCSPTAVSMILAFWSRELNRPELNYDVPEVARAVDDPAWPGTGNWAFNVGFAGAHPGVRAYVTRLSDVNELESWIARGVPVAVSVSYALLRGEAKPDSGHLVVCIGFTENGDIIVNDPGRRQVHQVYKRVNLVRAWRHSQNTVYLIYPEHHVTPPDPFGHWLAE
jgi:hypothetical protein